jgi:glycosyltransferase involved in cell wall biosynthesis
VAPEPFYEDRGTPIAVRQLLTALSQLAYEVDLLTYPVGQTVEIPGVRYVRAGNPFRLRWVPIGFSLRKLLLDATLVPALAALLAQGGYACVHAVEEAAFPAVVLGRRFRVPVIYDMQSSLPEQLAGLLAFKSRLAQSALSRSERWLLRHADSVVSSIGLASRVRAQVPQARLREWRYASPPLTVPPEEVLALRRELALPAGARVVLYTGTFEPYQGLPQLLEAIPAVRERHPRALFLLVGAEGSRRAEIEHRHGDLIRAGALRVVARQPREAIPRYLALAEVAVSPRAFGDNLPLKIFDYLAAGKAIVATDLPAHRALLDEERALLTAATAPALAEAVALLLADGDRAARLGAAAAAYAAERCGWLAFLRSVEELYQEVERVA